MNRLADEIVGVSAVSTALVTAHVDRAPVREEQKKDSLPEGSCRMYLAGVGDEIAQGQPMRAHARTSPDNADAGRAGPDIGT